jgi:hypothetical protein
MALILPDTPLGIQPPEVLRLHRLIKVLPGQDFAAWHRLVLGTETGPDFLVLRRDHSAMLLKVCAATPADLRSALQASLFSSPKDNAPVGVIEANALKQFVASIEAPLESVAIPLVVAFMNLNGADVERQVAPALPTGVEWIGKEHFAPDRFAAWLSERLRLPLSAEATTALRKAFTPEVVIPAAFTVRTPIARNTEAELTDYLLDYSQEWVLKSDLDLSDEARAATGDLNLRLVNGVAGSGKSLIIVYRAHLLHRLFPNKSILVLTHNRALIRDLETRYRRLGGDSHHTEWRTFQAWCRHHWPKWRRDAWHDPITLRQRGELVTHVWYKHLQDTAISERMLLDEIDWFKDRLLFTREDYLSEDRTGRGFALNESMRQRMFDAIEAYQQELVRHNRVDWGDVPRRMWQFIQQGRVTPPQYDVVLADEAQFFAPIWFEIIKAILKPKVGHLFLAADPTQGFLKRRQSWQASGLDVRGRTHRLPRSYRTTLEILNAATLLYRARTPDDDDDIVAPDLLDMPRGIYPVIVPLTSEQDEITRVINEVRAFIQAGAPPSNILIIHADGQGVDRLLQRLRREFGHPAAADPRDVVGGNHIRVCPLDAATGLESQIVFLVGAHLLYEREQSIRLSDEERVELIRNNTRRLYMAMTRAGQRLVITYVGEVPDTLRRMSATGK